jgi:hypothetical protein
MQCMVPNFQACIFRFLQDAGQKPVGVDAGAQQLDAYDGII